MMIKGDYLMKIKDLKDVIHSQRHHIQLCIVYNLEHDIDIACGSVEYIMEGCGELEINKIHSCYENGQDYIVFEVC